MMSAIQFRGHLYQFLDEVLAAGKPLKIKRNGKILKIVPQESPAKSKKPPKLTPRKGVIACEPEALIHHNWLLEWGERK